jgi:type IV pilus assembly protein PilA
MTTVAIAGIVAAIAIPAYQDYTLRAKVTGGLALAAPFKLAIAEFYASNGRFPDQNELAELSGSINLASDVLSDISIDPVSGILTLIYTDAALGDFPQLYLTPAADAGAIIWECSADIYERYLPADCR